MDSLLLDRPQRGWSRADLKEMGAALFEQQSSAELSMAYDLLSDDYNTMPVLRVAGIRPVSGGPTGLRLSSPPRPLSRRDRLNHRHIDLRDAYL